MIDKLQIKVCGMLHLPNREELESLPIDLFGFIFHPSSPRYVGHLAKNELSALVQTPRSRAGVFVNLPENEILNRAGALGLTHLQLHGEETPESCEQLRAAGYTIMKAFGVHSDFRFEIMEPYLSKVDYFLLDTQSVQKGGSGQQFDWEILGDYPFDVPFFLSGGIGPGDAGKIAGLSHPALRGIDLNSKFETAPGLKNYRALYEFFNQLVAF